MSEETKKVAENEEAKVETEEKAPAAEEAVEAKETPVEEKTEEKAEETPVEEKTEEVPAEEETEEKAEETPAEEETEEETEEKAEEAPAEEKTEEEAAKAKPKTTLRFLLLIILLTVAWFAWNKHQRDAKFNSLIEMADKGDKDSLAGAAAGFRKLMNESSGHLQKRCKQELVRIIIEQGELPSNNVQQSVVFYRQAYTVDPKALEIHQLRSILNQLKKDKTDKSIDPEMAKGIDAEMTNIKALIKAKIDEGIAKEKARRAALTPEQRKAEDDAAKAAAEEAKKMK